jgi:predicted nucleic acid-binding protein
MAAPDAFIDTSALYALIDKRDTHHAAARDAVGALLRSGRRMVTSDYVIAETINLANARGGTQVALRILDLLERSAGIRVEWIGPLRFDQTKAFFRKRSDHPVSFTDCSSFVVMRELRLSDALTTDRHFRQAGFQVLVGVA